jgi:hypothetical protein
MYAYAFHPHIKLTKPVLDLFHEALDTPPVPKHYRGLLPAFIRIFEAFLQVTSKDELKVIDLSHPKFQRIACEFIGAINSDTFYVAPATRRYDLGNVFNRLLNITKESKIPLLHIPPIEVATNKKTAFVSHCVSMFEALELNQEKVWVWRAWISINQRGNTVVHPLYPIYERMGCDFTERLYQCLSDYTTGRKSGRHQGIKELAMFIKEYPEEISPEAFQSGVFVRQFFAEFYEHYLLTGYANGTKPSTLMKQWKSRVYLIIHQYLIPSGLIAEPIGAIPCHQTRKPVETNVVGTGHGRVSTKLLTDIPLQITDEQAIDLLFNKHCCPVKH